MAVASAADLGSVSLVAQRLRELLRRARTIKSDITIEPPLPTTQILTEVCKLYDGVDDHGDQSYRFSVVETAAREIFYSLISSSDINEPAFVEVWDLLDILLLCGDEGICTPELVCWLTEELLESQTTHGCRTVFGYLESRRARLAQKDFHKKNLVLLRSCNELLRRLSRAEDAIFCGRVFFLLFQTFPLGDKSSVNLRGEFHVENATKFEGSESQPEQDGEKMDAEPTPVKAEVETATPPPTAKAGSKAVPIKVPPKKVPEEEVLPNSELYSIFWRLQQYFSDPTRLFTADNFRAFQKGLASTIAKFKKTPTVVQMRAADDDKRGAKRKLGEDYDTSTNGESDDHFQDNYNPKYLTSGDLFDLELSDLAFQRHILVQALILVDFLLSLTEKAKKRLLTVETPNKALLYRFTLSDEDTKWANSTRQMISTYLQTTTDGKLFNRMVDTVLARDKNWIRWKIEACPSIVRDPAPVDSELEARKAAREATRARRVPERPNGAMDLSFLDEGTGGGLEALKNPARFAAPSIEDLLGGIQNDELDLEMAMDDEEKLGLENAMANKRWRAVRQIRASRLPLLNKVEPGENLDAVLHPPQEADPQPTSLPVGDDDPDVALTSQPADIADTLGPDVVISGDGIESNEKQESGHAIESAGEEASITT